MPRRSALFGIAFCALFMRHSFVFAQKSPDLKDPAYKNGVLEKIAVLVESKYVLADKAKGFADEFKANCASGGDELGQIERSIRDSIGWAKTKDFRLLYGVIANDPDFLEVHPDGAVVRFGDLLLFFR